MRHDRHPTALSLVALAAALLAAARPCAGRIVTTGGPGPLLERAELACKVTMGPIRPSARTTIEGPRYESTCAVVAPIKGDCGRSVTLTFFDDSALGEPKFREGGTYVVVLATRDAPPQEVIVAIDAVPGVVPPRFGTAPADRFLAEIDALSKSDAAESRRVAAEQAGGLRDPRGGDVAARAAADPDPAVARAGVIALYRLGIAPDARQVMRLFNDQVLDVWYQESGKPNYGPDGKVLWQPGRQGVLKRGVDGFDYATYVREGAKLDWIRRDDATLSTFFGIPWKVQRRECVPELVALLDSPERKLRYWACVCLRRTVEDDHGPAWEQYERDEAAHLAKWRTWWAESGEAFVNPPATRPAVRPPGKTE